VPAGVIKIYTPRKYGHPAGSPYSRDFGDPIVIIGTPFAGDWRTLTVATGSVLKCKMSEYKVAKSGEESISLNESENGRSRENSRAAT